MRSFQCRPCSMFHVVMNLKPINHIQTLLWFPVLQIVNFLPSLPTVTSLHRLVQYRVGPLSTTLVYTQLILKATDSTESWHASAPSCLKFYLAHGSVRKKRNEWRALMTSSVQSQESFISNKTRFESFSISRI